MPPSRERSCWQEEDGCRSEQHYLTAPSCLKDTLGIFDLTAVYYHPYTVMAALQRSLFDHAGRATAGMLSLYQSSVE